VRELGLNLGEEEREIEIWGSKGERGNDRSRERE